MKYKVISGANAREGMCFIGVYDDGKPLSYGWVEANTIFTGTEHIRTHKVAGYNKWVDGKVGVTYPATFGSVTQSKWLALPFSDVIEVGDVEPIEIINGGQATRDENGDPLILGLNISMKTLLIYGGIALIGYLIFKPKKSK